MTDKKFQEKINQTLYCFKKYQQFLEQIEAEYERRFGAHPSDVDDDYWIDCFHVNPTPTTVKEITNSAKLRQ